MRNLGLMRGKYVHLRLRPHSHWRRGEALILSWSHHSWRPVPLTVQWDSPWLWSQMGLWTDFRVLLSSYCARHGGLSPEIFHLGLAWSKGLLLQKIGGPGFSFLVFVFYCGCRWLSALYLSPWTLRLWYAIVTSAEPQWDPASKFMPGQPICNWRVVSENST